MKYLNFKAALLLCLCLLCSIALYACAYFYNVMLIIPASILLFFEIAHIFIMIKSIKFYKDVEIENAKVDTEFNMKKTAESKLVNLSYKEYMHLIKKGYVPIGEDKTQIIELKKEAN